MNILRNQLIRINKGGYSYIGRALRETNGNPVSLHIGVSTMSFEQEYVSDLLQADEHIYINNARYRVTEVIDPRSENGTYSAQEIETGEIVSLPFLTNKTTLSFSLYSENSAVATGKLDQDINSLLKTTREPYSMFAIQNIVKAFNTNKKYLLSVLRKSPKWNEDSLAIVDKINVTYVTNKECAICFIDSLRRKCEKIYRCNPVVLDKCNNILDIDWDDFSYLFSLFEKSFTTIKPTSADSEALFKKFKLSTSGGKTCRLIRKMLEHTGMLEELMKNTYTDKFGKKKSMFEREFAAFSDAATEVTKSVSFIMSVHPCDYLSMSHGNSWTSCHSIEKRGCYSSGTLSYMNDKTSMICYTLSEIDEKIPLFLHRKVNREVFCLDKEALLQSRIYPEHSDLPMAQAFEKKVFEILKECDYDFSKWTVDEKSYSALEQIESSGSHYRDYSYNTYYGRFWALNTCSKIEIGSDPICLKCGRRHGGKYPSCSTCESTRVYTSEQKCNAWFHCIDCGRDITQIDASVLMIEKDENITIVCDSCSCVCDKCGERHRRSSTVRYENDIYCKECADKLLYSCSMCGKYEEKGSEIVDSDGVRYCSSCSDVYLITCSHCGKRHNSSQHDFISNGKGELICNECADCYEQCQSCAQYFIKDEVHDGCCNSCIEETAKSLRYIESKNIVAGSIVEIKNNAKFILYINPLFFESETLRQLGNEVSNIPSQGTICAVDKIAKLKYINKYVVGLVYRESNGDAKYAICEIDGITVKKEREDA